MKTTITLNQIFRNFSRLQRSCFSAVFLLLFLLSASSSWGQITQRGTATSANQESTNMTDFTINKPSGVVAGDVMIASFVQNETDNDNGGMIDVSLSGWTIIDGRTIYDQGTNNGYNLWRGTVLYRVADGTEGADFTFSTSVRADMIIGSIVAFSGVDVTGGVKADGTSGGPFDRDPGTLNVTNAGTSTASGVTTLSANAAVLMLSLVNNDRTFSGWVATNPASLTELYENITTNGDDASVGAAWAIRTTAGATGNGTVTLSASDRSGAMFLVLKRCTSPMSVASASSTPTLCINTALTNITHTTTGATGIGTATGLPSGVTAAWASNTITISGTPTASGTFSYSIPLTGGCGSSVSATGTITVTAANTAGTASSTPTLCINTALTNITRTTTGATGIGTATGLPAGVTAAFASNTITISGTPTATGTFNYTIPLTGGCGTVNATGTITVINVAMTAGVPSSSPTLRINTAISPNITIATTGATGISNSGVSGANGLPAGVSASWASNTITISGTPTVEGVFNYSIPLTGGCNSVNATGTITVVTYKSQFISANLGSTNWCPGETRQISVTIKNVGSATWADGAIGTQDINVGVKWNTNGGNWSDYHVRTDAGGLAPGETGTFNFTLTAANNTGSGYTTNLAAGSNNITFDLVYEGISWFAGNGGGVGPGNSVSTSAAQTILALPTVTSATENSKTYTGIANATTVSAVASSGATIDWYDASTGGTLLASGTLTYAPTGINVGTYTVFAQARNTTTGCTSAARTSATLTITAKALTITGITANNKVYDGVTTATISGTEEYVGLENGESFIVLGSPVASFTTAGVGTGKTVTVTGYSAPSSNYTLTNPSLTANITAATLTITADNVVKATGATLTSGAGNTAFIAVGLVNDETISSVTMTYGAAAASGTTVGTYANQATPSAATGGTFTAANYTISYVSGSIIVGNARYSVATGNWNATSTWSTSSGGSAGASAPVAGDLVFIERGFTVTVSANAVCGSLQVGSSTSSSGTLNMNANISLSISANLTVGGSGNSNRTGTINFASGSSIAANNLFLGGTATIPAIGTITMTNGGTLTLNGDITINTAVTNVWTPGTGTLILAGTTTLPSTIFSSFNNLTINSGATVTSGRSFSVGGTMTVNGSFIPGATGHVISGAGTLNGSGSIDVNLVSTSALTTQYTITTRTLTNLTVDYSAAGNQSLASSTYGALTTSGSGTKTLLGGTTINNAVTIGLGTTLNASIFTHAIKGNWVNNGTFTPSTSTIQFTGTSAQHILGSVATTFNNFTVNNSSGVTLSGTVDATVNGTLTLTSGLVTPNTNYFTLGSAGTISGASSSSYINGLFSRVITGTSAVSFPIGKGGNYRPVTFTYASAPGTKTVKIEQFETASPLSISTASTILFGSRYWSVDQSETGVSYTIGLNNSGNSPTGTVVMLRREGTGSTTQNATSFSTPTYTNSSSFSTTNISNDVMLAETSIPLTVTGATTANKEYDGTNTASVTGGTLVGIVGSDEVTLTQSGTFAQTGVGTGIAITSTSTISGANASAYTLTQPSLTARNITAKALTVSGATTANKVYDRTNTATVTGGTLIGVVGSDVVTLTQSGTFAQTGVGTSIAITSTSTISGANSGNYTLTQPILTARNITALALTVTGATTANKGYDGTNTATVTGGTLVGVISPDVVNLTQSGTFAQTGVGTGIAITSTSTISGANSGNYTLTQPSLTARNITAKALTVTGATTANKAYDGNNTATVTGGTLVGVISPDVVNLTQSGTFAQTGVGTGIAITSTSTISGANSGNYTLTQPSLTARNITAKALTVTGATTANKAYDGNNTATVTGGTLVGVISPDVVNLTQSGTFAQTGVGTGIAITSTSTIGGANSGNYTLTQPSLTARNITAKALTVTGATTANKAYDGNNTATVTGGTLVGIVGSDVVTLTQSGTFAQTGVGTGIAITSTSTIGGANAANYSLTQPSLTARNITAKALTVTGATTANKVYDGTNTATVTGGTLVGIVGSDVVTLTQSGTFAQTGVGTGIAITSTSTIGGANAGNYSLTQPSLTARDITAKALTVIGLTGSDKIYDGNTTATASGTASLSGLVSSDVVTLIGTPTFTFASANVGTGIIISTTGYSISGTNSGNYTLTQPTLSANITLATPVVTVTVGTYIYNGSAQGPNAATNTGTGSSYTFSYVGTGSTTYAASSTRPTDAGTYTATVTVAANGNFGSASSGATSFSLATKDLTITADNAAKCFGETYTLENTAFTSSELQNGETIGSVTLTSSGVSSDAEAASYSIVPSGATGGTFTASNYSINYVNGSLVVNPVSVGGTVAGGATVCSGTNSTELTLSGHTGSVTRWESSLDNFATSGTPIANTTETLTATNLAATTSYRAVVTSGACAAANSATATVTVSPASVAPTSATASVTTMCGSGSATLTLTGGGGQGATIKWYTSSCGGTLVGTGNGLVVSPTSTTTYYGRYEGSCDTTSCASVTITFISATTTTWNGTTWSNGAPTASTAAIISGTFTTPGTNPNYNLRACKLTVNAGATVLIKSGDSVTLDGALIASPGSFVTFNSGANLIQYGTTNENTGAIVIKRESARIRRLDYSLWSSPVAAQGLQAFSPNTLSNRFYSYNSSTNLYQAVDPSATTFSPFNGYLIRTANTHPTTPTTWTGQFTGVPNNGNYSMSFTGYRVIGNPYPSAIDAETFIDTNIDNGSISGTVYFWRKTNGAIRPAYCTYNLGGFVSNGDDAISLMPSNANNQNNVKVLQVGQGFIVEGTGTSNVVFTNDMRIDSNVNRFLRTANTIERNRIWLNITNAAGSFSQAMIAYMTGATQGVDPSIDGKLLTDGDVSLASLIGTTSYTIQGRSLPFDMTDVVPMSFKVTTAGDYTITIDHVDGLFSNGAQTVYLRDNTTGVVHNLSAGGYTFTSASGTFDTRFEIIYQSTSLAVSTPTFNESQVVIYKTPTNEISINTGNVVMSKVKIFDIRGRLLQEKKDINASQTLMNAGLTTEVLLVQITSEEGIVVTKKVLFPRTSLKLDKKIEVKTQLAEDE